MISKISYSFVIADLLHYGHVRLLKKAKEVSDYHICGLISDEACHKWQGISVSNFEERKNVLERLDCIDEIINQKSMDPTENLKLIHDNFPKAKLIVVHGDDWQSIPGKDYVKKIGGEVIQPEYYSKLSREKIIDKFRDDNNLNGFDHEYYNEHFLIGKIEHFKENKNNLISSKANTLENFKSILKKSHIEPMYVFEVEEFKNNTEKIIEEVSNKFRGEIVVRSSSHQEDNLNESKAGYFDSIIGVDSQSYQDINCAINKVIDSFDHKDKKRDQILVQKHTKKIKKSGVVFTRNIKDNSPYYFINYDDESSRTDTVTNGSVGKAVWFYKGLDVNAYPEEWKGLVSAVKEIENKIPGMVLDIEFAEKNDGTIVIFQIRPLAANVKFKSTIDDEHYDNVLNNNIQRYLESERDLYNNKRILSDMAFWNPAEIIGDNPANLDYSLYREIITSGSWNEGLIPLGYSKIAKELMEKYANKPYINVDYSFYSLTPSSLDDKITRKLINYYRNKLINDKTSHDKIEFEISFNCYTCSTENDLSELLNYNFNYEELNELKNSLKKLTINCITNYKNILDNDLRDLKKLIISSGDLSIDDTNPFNLIEKALNLLEDIKKYGTPQFS
ncbi:MAG: adenylyltransferase/cytidyltransferase family protein, partial [Bacillota bacterium]